MTNKIPKYDEQEFSRLGARRRELTIELRALDRELRPQIAAARGAGVLVETILDITGYRSREYIRTITRDYGVEAPKTWARTIGTNE